MRSDSNTHINAEHASEQPAIFNLSRKNTNNNNNHSGMKPLKVGIPRIGATEKFESVSGLIKVLTYFLHLLKLFLCKQAIASC